MSNPFAALFEDVDRSSDPMLVETDFSDEMFAPLAPPIAAPPQAPPVLRTPKPAPAQVAPKAPVNALHEMLSPRPAKRKTMQAALVITWEQGREPDLMELNDLLASGWRVATTAGFPTADGGRGSLLVVVEQESPM